MSEQKNNPLSSQKALYLITSSPNSYLLLCWITLELYNSYEDDDLEDDEIYFYQRNLRVAGHKPMLTPHQVKTALKNLINFGCIQVSSSEFGKRKIIKLIVNPFKLLGR